jgi:carboxymethylenebutenolidase
MRGMDVTIPGGGGDPDTPAYAVLPAGARRGAVVIHEALGRQPEIDRVVDRFAEAGYAAVAPDLLAAPRSGAQRASARGERVIPRVLCIARVVRACATGEGLPIRQAEAARRWLNQRVGIEPSRVGLIGFCLGGGFALAAGRGWGAVSANYGQVPPARLLRGIGPVIACYGERDRMFAPQAAKLRTLLAGSGVDHEVHTFPTVGHSFLTDGDHPIGQRLSQPLLRIRYDHEVAEDAWSRIFAFFGAHLGDA